jgi:hypothetical protein
MTGKQLSKNFIIAVLNSLGALVLHRATKHLFIVLQYNTFRYRLSNTILHAIITFQLHERVLHIFLRCGIRTGSQQKVANSQRLVNSVMESTELKSAISELSARVVKIRDWL